MHAVEPDAVETDGFECKSGNRITEQAHDDFFSEILLEYGYAERNPLAPCFRAEAAVLRETFFVEFHVGEHFNARSDCRRGVFRQLHRIVQYAVDAVADEKRLLEWFDMNVRRILRGCVAKQGVYDAHRRPTL